MADTNLQGVAELEPRRVAVVLVDFQNDFCHPDACRGRLPTNTANAATARRADDFARRAASLGGRIIHTQQVLNRARLTPRQRQWERAETGLCVEGSWGAELFVDPLPGAAIVRKDRFDLWQSPEFIAVLAGWRIEGLIITGVELRCCVLYAVLGAEERGYRYIVPHNLVSWQDDDAACASVREYLTLVHHAPPTADGVLAAWAEHSAIADDRHAAR